MHNRIDKHTRTHARMHAIMHSYIYCCLQEWAAKKAKSNIPRDKYAYVKTKAEMAAVDTDKVQHLFGGSTANET